MAFVFVFYDGYRFIYDAATGFLGKDPTMTPAVAVEKARIYSYDVIFSQVDFLQRRDTLLDTDEPMDARHKLRWLYRTIETPVYRWVGEHVSISVAHYTRYLHSALWMVATLLFVSATLFKLRRGSSFEALAVTGVALYGYIAMVSTMPRMVDPHSIIEMGTMSAAVYYSFRRNIFAFFIVTLIAVSNRETGAFLGIVYGIINWRRPYFWVPVLVAPMLLAAINIDLLLLPEFWSLVSQFMVRGGVGYISIFTVFSVPISLVVVTAIKMFIVLAPAVILIPRIWHDEIGKRLSILGATYLGILMSGTILGNVFTYAMLLPIMAAMLAIAYPAKSDAIEHQ